MSTDASFYQYWRILVRRKLVLAVSLSTALVACAIYVRYQPTIYQADVLLKVLQQQDDLSPQVSPTAYAVRHIASLEVAQKAAAILGLAGPGTSQTELAQKAGEIAASYSAVSLDEQGLVRLSVRHADRITAAETVNAVAQAFKDYEQEETGRQLRQNFDNISQRTEQVKLALAKAESSRQIFLEKSGPIGSAETLTTQLNDLEYKRKDLLSRYTEKYPDVVEIKRRIASVQAKLNALPARETELNRLTREVRTNEDLFSTLSKQLEATRIALTSVPSSVQILEQAVPPKSPVSPNKPRSYATSIALGLIVGVMLAFFFENLDLSIINIEELERFMQLPILAIIPSFDALRAQDLGAHLMNRFKPPSLEENRRFLLISRSPKTKIAEPYHALRANILSRVPSRSGAGLALLFTSASSGEGKTLTSINFAFAAAGAGLRVLLVDMDMRRSSVHRLLGVEYKPGFTDIISGKTSWREAMQGTVDLMMNASLHEQAIYFPGIDNIKIISAGTDIANKMDILENERMEQFVEQAKAEFDLVVFDTPPVLIFVDALLLARTVDAAVLVYGAGKTTRMALKRAKEQLQGFGKGKLLGIAVNNLHTAEMNSHYGGYYSSR